MAGRAERARARRERAAADEYDAAAVERYVRADEAVWASPSETFEALADLCRQEQPRSVLELGVGTGRYFPALCGQRYVGVDLFAPMLAVARSRQGLLAEQGFTEVELVEADVVAAVDEVIGPFDLVFSIGCLGYHVPVDATLLGRIGRLLAPGGRLFLQTPEMGLRRRVRDLPRRAADRLRPGSAFFVDGRATAVHRAAGQAGFEVLSHDRTTKRFYGRPMNLFVLGR